MKILSREKVIFNDIYEFMRTTKKGTDDPFMKFNSLLVMNERHSNHELSMAIYLYLLSALELSYTRKNHRKRTETLELQDPCISFIVYTLMHPFLF